MPKLNAEALLALRTHWVKEGRALSLDTLKVSTTVCVIAFNGDKGAPRLIKSGMFLGRASRELVYVQEHGASDLATVRAEFWGLVHGEKPMLICTNQLDGTLLVDERPECSKQTLKIQCSCGKVGGQCHDWPNCTPE